MRVHVEGCGVLGAILGWHLEAQRIPWTWNDTDQKVNAWRACTGAIFPTGDAEDMRARRTWDAWAAGMSPWAAKIPNVVERAGWWYCTKAPPHKAKGKPVARVGGLQRLATDSLHFNAQMFVPASQQMLAHRRVSACPAGSVCVVSHGFSSRLDRVVWGWTRMVQIRHVLGAPRPAIYLREGRYVMAYAYPINGTAWWYAGSSLIAQKQAKDLSFEGKYATWKTNFERLAQGVAEVCAEGAYMTGWRPSTLSGGPLVLQDGASLIVRPHWHNGVRAAPNVVRAVFQQLRLPLPRGLV